MPKPNSVSRKAAREPEERPTESVAESERRPRSKGRPFVKGDPRINRTKAGPGRPKNKYKRWCRKVLERAQTKRAVRTVLSNPDSGAFATMYKELAARAYGKVEQPVKVDATLKLEDLLDASNNVPPSSTQRTSDDA